VNYHDVPLRSVKSTHAGNNAYLYNPTFLLERERPEPSVKQEKPPKPQPSLTRKSFQLLLMLMENGKRGTFFSFHSNQADLARRLEITRQALSVHFKRLRELGMLQVGRGFVNVTQEGLRAAGYNTNPVIVTARLTPQKRLEIFKKVAELPLIEMFRVTGDMDMVLVVEQEQLDRVLEILDQTDGVLETKSLVTIETLK
jgi:DNA-binding Lrp family transcriptional regulator